MMNFMIICLCLVPYAILCTEWFWEWWFRRKQK